MRKLRIVIATTKGALPALVLASLLPGGQSCSRTGVPGQATSEAGAGGAAGESASSTGVTSSSGLGGFHPVSSSSSSGAGGGFCGGGEPQQTFEVELPPAGVPATPGQICAVMTSPVESGDAARVKLTKDPSTLQIATGFIEIAPALAGTVVGLPTVEVVSAWAPEVFAMQVTNVQPSGAGFSFDAAWPQPFVAAPESWALLQVKTTFEVLCDAASGQTRTVDALTNIRLCFEQPDDIAWMSSGEECTICRVIAEMAPSPIVPDKAHDELPLARALRLRVVPLARVGRAVVLLAENDGGSGVSYRWRSSGGEVIELAADVVLWTPPEASGPHQIQAAVVGDDAAAVASFMWQEVA